MWDPDSGLAFILASSKLQCGENAWWAAMVWAISCRV